MSINLKATIVALCEKLFVTPSGYHACKKRKPSLQKLSNDALLIEIKRIHESMQNSSKKALPAVSTALLV